MPQASRAPQAAQAIRLLMVLLLGGVLPGCASAKPSGIDDVDLAPEYDFATGPVGPSGPDFSQSPDLLSSQDLRVAAADLSVQQDLSGPADLSVPRDLRAITGCQIVPQAGCPAMMKCTTHDVMTTVCDPVGTDARGAACTGMAGVDSCVAANVCIDESAGQTMCRRYCKADGDCGARSFCDYALDMAMAYKICTQPCNAVYPGTGAGSNCHAGLGCFVFGAEHTDCRSPGMVADGGPCSANLDCKAGLACIGAAGASLCRRVCPYRNDAFCGGANACVDVAYGAFTWPTYGVCCPGGVC